MLKFRGNDPCPCGSNKKYKKCCLAHDPVNANLQRAIVRGYSALMTHRSVQASESWWQVWLAVRARLRPEMNTTDAAQRVYPDPVSHIHDWLQDLVQELSNAARHSPEYASRGIALCREVLNQFTGETELFVQCFRADLGELYILDGRFDEGERELTALIDDYPDTAIGYVRLSDMLRRPKATASDLRQALEILHRALQRPVADASNFDIHKRIQWIQENLEKIANLD